jgi:N-acetylmuramoyl-L-alanine amidase
MDASVALSAMIRMSDASRAAARTLVWVVLFLFPPLVTALGENTMKVVFSDDPSRNTSIGVFERQGVTYLSLSDLTNVLRLNTFENTAARKLEIKLPSGRIKVSGDNPFLVLTDEGQRRSIHQLSADVVYAADAYFVPLVSFVPIFGSLLDGAISYDAEAGLLRAIAAPIPRLYDFSSLVIEQKANGMLVRIPATRPLKDMESWFTDDGWLYVTIADAKADVASINKTRPAGLIRQIVAVQSPTSVQLTFKLTGKVASTELQRDEQSNDLLISIRTPTVREKELLAKRQEEIQAGLEAQRERWKLDVIVLDAGHGGKDNGTTGVTGVHEKEITLGITLKLGKLIEKNLKGVKVVYTRKDDRFVELHRRGQIANEAGGKLFVSIHANSMNRKPHPRRGFEVYLLRPGRTEEAVEIAERENSVIELEEGYEERYKQLTEENFILVTMAQSAYVKASELFADISQQELEKSLRIPNGGVRQAGFYVLVGASMPNVLVETAYLSNREDERYLKSQAGQQRIAGALFRAIKRYKEEYEKLLREGTAIGENR